MQNAELIFSPGQIARIAKSGHAELIDSRGRGPGCGALGLMTHDEAGTGRPGPPPCAGSPVPSSPSLRGGAGRGAGGIVGRDGSRGPAETGAESCSWRTGLHVRKGTRHRIHRDFYIKNAITNAETKMLDKCG